MNKIIGIFFILIGFASFSQKNFQEGQYFQDGTGKLIKANKDINSEIEGNPYLPEKWTEGVVTLKNGQILKYKALRFNMLSGELEYLWGDDSFSVTQPMGSFSLNDLNFKNGFTSIDKQSEKSFYQVLYDGKNKLLCNKSVQIVGATPFVTVTTKARSFQQNDSYYLQKADGSIAKIKNDKKNILAQFPQKEAQIEDFCKKEGVKLKKWEEISKLLAFIESN